MVARNEMGSGYAEVTLNVASKVSYSRCTSSLDFIIIFYSSIVTNTIRVLEET